MNTSQTLVSFDFAGQASPNKPDADIDFAVSVAKILEGTIVKYEQNGPGGGNPAVTIALPPGTTGPIKLLDSFGLYYRVGVQHFPA